MFQFGLFKYSVLQVPQYSLRRETFWKITTPDLPRGHGGKYPSKYLDFQMGTPPLLLPLMTHQAYTRIERSYCPSQSVNNILITQQF